MDTPERAYHREHRAGPQNSPLALGRGGALADPPNSAGRPKRGHGRKGQGRLPRTGEKLRIDLFLSKRVQPSLKFLDSQQQLSVSQA
jgi:hypothetical protein